MENNLFIRCRMEVQYVFDDVTAKSGYAYVSENLFKDDVFKTVKIEGQQYTLKNDARCKDNGVIYLNSKMRRDANVFIYSVYNCDFF